MTPINQNPSYLKRSVNEGFSGGEKKRNEILQLLCLEPDLAIMDETDSGLDIDENIFQEMIGGKYSPKIVLSGIDAAVKEGLSAKVKHSKVNPKTCLIGPQLWPYDKIGRFLVQDVASYKKIISPSQWNKDFYKTKWYLPDEKVGVWPVGIEIPHNVRNIQYDCLLYYKRRSAEELEIVEKFLKKKLIMKQL